MNHFNYGLKFHLMNPLKTVSYNKNRFTHNKVTSKSHFPKSNIFINLIILTVVIKSYVSEQCSRITSHLWNASIYVRRAKNCFYLGVFQ